MLSESAHAPISSLRSGAGFRRAVWVPDRTDRDQAELLAGSSFLSANTLAVRAS